MIKDTEEENIEELGYKSSCEKAISILNNYGYSVEFFAEVYDYFRSELYSQYCDGVEEGIIETVDAEEIQENTDIIIEAKVQEHISSFPRLSLVEELRDFIQFLSVLYRNSSKVSAEDSVHFRLSDGREYSVEPSQYLKSSGQDDLYFVDFEELQMYIFDKHLKFPPWIIMLCSLFDFDYFRDYPEIISLMYLRLTLETVNKDAEVRLNLSDIVDDEEEAHQLNTQLVEELTGKVNLYNKVFRTLFSTESEIREKYVKSHVRDLMAACKNSTDRYEKGKLLEELVELLFTSNNFLELSGKRVTTDDEEIDIIVKNNIDKPFWLSFGSPLFFIECKNWSTPIGSKHIRDFEIKLQNHAKLAKIGFFISINGFTSETRNELRRAGRDEYHMVLLDENDILEYVNSEEDFFSWLENKVSVLH